MAIITFTAGTLIRSSDVNNNFNEIWVTKGIQNYSVEHNAAGTHKAISGTSISVSGAVAGGSLSISGSGAIGNGLSITQGNVTITSGNLVLSSGNIDVIGDVSITGNTVASGNLTVSGNVVVTGGLTVSDVSKFKNMGSGVVTASSGTLALSLAGPADAATSSGNFVDVTDLTVNIKTNGQPVFVGVQPYSVTAPGYLDADNDNPGDTIVNVSFRFVRTTGGSTSVLPITSIVFQDANVSGPVSAIPPGALWYIDTPSAGNHEYKLQYRVNNDVGTDQVHVRHCKLVAYEFK
jgi:hypothetical protein